jgi:uncharacterized membrane protein
MTDYLNQLEKLLSPLSESEREDVLTFYREYCIDADLTDDASIRQHLGTPKKLARQILADYSIQTEPDEAPTPQRNFHRIWLILLGLAASPIAIPIAICLVLTILAGLAAVGLIAFAAVLVLAAFIVLGGFLLVVGITLFFKAFAVGVFYLGAGLAVLCGSYLLSLVAYAVIRGLLQIGVAFSQTVYRKVRKPQGGFNK